MWKISWELYKKHHEKCKICLFSSEMISILKYITCTAMFICSMFNVQCSMFNHAGSISTASHTVCSSFFVVFEIHPAFIIQNISHTEKIHLFSPKNKFHLFFFFFFFPSQYQEISILHHGHCHCHCHCHYRHPKQSTNIIKINTTKDKNKIKINIIS